MFTYASPKGTFKPIKVSHVKYHRNGVGGTGFHVVRFTWPWEGYKGCEFIGIVFPEAGHVAVVLADDPEQRFRGDNFEPELRECVRQYDQWFDPAQGRM